jgi:membrane protein DedA with SNARE-associated domain
VPDLGELVGHWGYGAIFVVVVLGNFGLPLPEETVLVLGGYMAWQGTLRLAAVLAVGVVSAAIGDNLGYWMGRRYGRATLERYGRWVAITPERLEVVWRFVLRHGSLGVFAARFFPGLRIMAGPIAGASGLGLTRFVVANLLGALCYVPYAVGIGYALGYGLGPYVEPLRRAVGDVEKAALALLGVVALVLLVRRAIRARRLARPR